MATRRDYAREAVEAAHSVLIELAHLLVEYREKIVLIGGWVPEFLCSSPEKPHIGSVDIDLALDHRRISQESYKTIEHLLQGRGYLTGNQPFVFVRKVKHGDREINVSVDLLSGEYEGTGRGRRHQRIQGILARKVRGCDLAFDLFVEVTIEGELPDGGKDSVTIRVASMVPFISMKGLALDERLKEKDAWDIYYCIRNYPGGLETLAGEFKPHVDRRQVREGLDKIAKHFAGENHVGPTFVADFEEVTDPEERAFLKRDAFERVQAFLGKLGMVS
ncbi:MAG: hypothetical protein HYU64_15475 [Armatimonadetes bacterium]|nr:hypothetical protein [Armatimonadota bacterium]